ncbi:MAG: dihydropteroate synthase [Paracoccaceae bacterium]
MSLAGGSLWFTQVEAITRAGFQILDARDMPEEASHLITRPRAPIAGLDMAAPRIMGILNVTPDSFSDGGKFLDPSTAAARGRAMATDGADILDIGGESTRPGAATVEVAEEIDRTAPVIAALTAQLDTPISIDTRKCPVAEAALDAGAALVNDVAALSYDPSLVPLCVDRDAPVCIMHAQGDPETMQQNPRYDNVLLDVYDYLEDRVVTLEGQGIPRARILVDPGIGFGKTVEHNLTLLRGLSIFHGLGCAILVGASRKRFIGTIGEAPRTEARLPGSLAVGLAALAQGVQMLRVHDVGETAQAMRLWQAVH